MKSFKIAIFTLLITFGFTPLFAHGGTHTHKSDEIPEVKIKDISSKYLSKLIYESKIEKSWLKSSIVDSEKKIFGKKTEWIISYGNDYIKDVEKKILYIFVDMKGNVTGANYTGI